jgi:hypothetical protein
LGIISTPKSSGRCHGVPRNERAQPQKALTAGAKPMSSNGEQVANDVVDREEPLGLCHRFEAPHMPLAPPGGLVGDFGPVVGVSGGVVNYGRHDDPVRGAVAPDAIGNEAVRDTAAPLEQVAKEPRGGVALREEVFDVAEAERKPVVEPDRVANDGGRKTVAGILGKR